MRFRLLRLRFRRRLHVEERRAEDLSQQAEVGIEKYVFKRIGRLHKVRRFIAAWAALLLIAIIGTLGQNYLLSDYFQTLRPVPGGIYNEGLVGTFTTANPIYAVNDVDMTVSRLIFAPLFNYDSNNQLAGDLASSYSVNSIGNVYTVHLKPNLTWQDGTPLTSKDVVFTYNLIENPNAQSPLFNSWQGVTVSAQGPSTVVFNLPSTLASFPQFLTGGILPEHLLDTIPASEMRSATFNSQDPVGSGPFSWQAISVSGNDPSNATEQIVLSPFDNFVGGKPKLQQFVLHAYANQSQLRAAFTSGQLNGAEGFSNNPPAQIANMKNVEIHNYLLTAGIYSFFKTSSGILSDPAIRSALVQSVNVPNIISNLSYPTHEVNEPLLEGQLGYNPAYRQPGYNLAAAKNILNQDGWTVGAAGIRYKAGQQLTFSLTASNSSSYIQLANQLISYWKQLGVNVNLVTEDPSDFSNVLQSHDYQAVLYGVSIGVDPDVYVYWDSSQAQANAPSRLNLSEWSNTKADSSLEEGRTRLDPNTRVVAYQDLLSAWQQDSPALGLYQPRLLYVTNGPVFGLNGNTVNSNTDRFNNVQNWEIDEAKVTD
ncbi:MAG: peptide ABC transporter substrate-binding protein [Candidatus Saccharibacteria bacterium]